MTLEDFENHEIDSDGNYVDFYCFRVYVNNLKNMSKNNLKFYSTIIYKALAIIPKTVSEPERFIATPVASTAKKLPHRGLSCRRSIEMYTKCNSTTIEELKNEFPEIFI